MIVTNENNIIINMKDVYEELAERTKTLLIW